MQAYLASNHQTTRRSSQRGWLRTALLAGIGLFATLPPATAVPLPPGGSVALVGGTSGPGTVIRDTSLPFEIRNGSAQLLLSGNVQDRVVRLTATSRLSFEPRVKDLVATALGAGYFILEARFTGYDETTTDVGYSSTGSGTVAPTNAYRDSTGDQVTFLYPASSLLPPASSRFCYTVTNAPAYHLEGRITIVARNVAGQTFSTVIEGTAAPTRLEVHPGGVIQPAIDAAEPGETVIVHPGTYNESLTLRSGINVKGENAGVVILRPPSDPGVDITNCTNTEFSGFTVTPAVGAGATIGIQASGGSPVVKNNIITGFGRYGVRLLSGCTAIVCGNRIQNNANSGNASLDYGIISLSSKPLISNNLISGNECGCYIGWHESDGAQFINNTVVDNTSQGLWCYSSNPIVKNNLVTGNSAGISASFDNATPVLTYNDCWGNSWLNYDAQSTGVLNPGTGSISVDPLFDPAAPGDYHLRSTSPCRDAGDPAFIYNDLDGSRNDIGWTGGPCANPGESAAPFGGFLFTSVGNIPASYIASSGLATVPAGDAAALQIPAWNQAPFGAQPYLFGVFGSGVSPVYYTIECKPAADPEGAFAPLNHQLSKVKYTISGTGVTAAVESVGPLYSSGVPYYRVTNNGGTTYWANDTLKLILNSPQLPDGTYDFRLKAFTAVLSAVTLTGPANHLTLRINNRRPAVEIISIARASGSLITECGIVNLTSPQENLSFRITAEHADGFLDDYSLVALVGRNRYAGLIASDNHVPNHAGQVSWTGVNNALVQSLPAMTAVPPRLSPWESCAYQFRLGAWARTTNGYGRIFYSEFFWNVAMNLSGADLDGDGDVDGDDLNLFAAAYGSSNN